MKQIALVLCLLLFTAFTFGQQKFTVSGKIIDSITKKPIEFATISFQDDKDLVGTTSNKNGEFSYAVPYGSYRIKIEYLSYTSKEFIQQDIKAHLDLDTIALVLSDELLDEVEITATKKLVEFNLDKKIYNASSDIANKGGNALDVLNNTPSARVDDDGRVLIRGAKTTILVDGKPIFSLEKSTAILKAIPANTIDKVEIISSSAKYSANINGVILNIITKKRKVFQTNGAVRVFGGLPNDNGFSLFLNDKTDKINIYATISFINNLKIKHTKLRQTLLDNSQQIQSQFNQDTKDTNQKNSFLFSLGSDFYLNKNNTITTALFVNTIDKNYISDFTLSDFNPSQTITRKAVRESKYFDNYTKLELFFNYTTVLDTLGQQLSLDFKYDNITSRSHSLITEKITYPATGFINQKDKINQQLDKFLFQVDYILPLPKNKKIELGYKGNFRLFNNVFNVLEFNPDLNEFITIGDLNDIIRYNDKVHGFFGLYSASHNKVSYNIGLRTELSDISFQAASSTTNISKNYIDIFPSATVSYDFKNNDHLSIDYHRGIERPTIVQLNPFIYFGNERFQYVGNPKLDPSSNHYFELMYGKDLKKLSISSSLYANFTKNIILTTIIRNGQNTKGLDLFIFKPLNNGSKNVIGFDTNISYNPTKKIRLGTYISPFNVDITNTINQNYDFNSWVLYTSSYALVSLKKGLRFQVSHVYQSKVRDRLTNWKAITFAGFSASKSLCKENATLTFKINDIFNSKLYSEKSNEANAITNRNYQFNQKFSVSFTYRFKQKRQNSKDRSNDINSDELENIQDEKL